MSELIHKELSGQIIGALFEVHNQLGTGLLEKYYQRALAEEFKKRQLEFKQQVSVPISYKGVAIGRRVIDFFVAGKVVVEIKKDSHFSRQHIEQTISYLKALNVQLGILANFTGGGVKFKRILNLY